MTYGECKKASLGHIFAESIAGDEIELTYNNQADYVKRIPGLINDVQTQIATTARKIPAVAKLDDLYFEDLGYANLYELPEDLYQMQNGGLLKFNSEHSHFAADHVRDYRIVGDKLLVPKRSVEQGLLLEYWRYPIRLSDDPKDNVTLDNVQAVHEVIPFYVAAHLVMYDDSFRYSALYNEFETRLSRLSLPVYVEESEVIDTYGGFDWCDY